jgi:hypothetical protein
MSVGDDKSPLPEEVSGSVGRMRLAELTSGVGAGVMGVGIGVVLANHIRGLGVPILVVGGLLHAWGMVDKHRLEARARAPRPRWSMALYWLCWALLALVAAYAVARSR